MAADDTFAKPQARGSESRVELFSKELSATGHRTETYAPLRSATTWAPRAAFGPMLQ
jgi:hypothetical protein